MGRRSRALGELAACPVVGQESLLALGTVRRQAEPGEGVLDAVVGTACLIRASSSQYCWKFEEPWPVLGSRTVGRRHREHRPGCLLFTRAMAVSGMAS